MADEHNNIPENNGGVKPRGFSSKKNIIFIILVAVLTFGIGSAVIVVGVSNTSGNRLTRHMRAAEHYLSEMNYERAVIEYQRVLEIDSMNVDAILGLAEAYIGLGDMEKAIETLCDGLERTGDEHIRIRLDELTKTDESSDWSESEAAFGELEVSESEGFSEKDAIKVNFERFYEGLYEYTIITGIDNTGNTVWTYQTKYMGTELDRVSEIGTRDDSYYFVEDGSIIVMNLSDGTVKWKNDSFGGSGTAFAFGDDGSLYICGYYGPDFFAVDRNGNTIKSIEHFDSDYYWPYEMEYLGYQVKIIFAGIPDWVNEKAVFCVNLDDFTYYRESDFSDQ